LWYPLSIMSKKAPLNYARLYAGFQAPITVLDCGKKCAPHNEHGVPFCCDTRHAVPTVYEAEWEYLSQNTDLWHIWQPEDPLELKQLQLETPEGMLLVECLGHRLCQRGFRSLTCRAFPFFPYLNTEKEFIGLSYYWEYEDRCWVISNLQVVTLEYRDQFIHTFERVFAEMPEERDAYARHSAHMRRLFIRQRRTIPLLTRDGLTYKISPRTEQMRQVSAGSLPKFGPYKVAALLPFPDELAELKIGNQPEA
jgi:hypothetical protein